MKGNLESAINAIHPMPEDVMEQFLNAWHLTSCPKKTVLSEINSVDKYLYFITRGVQKAYYLNDGKEYIVAFNYPYNFSCAPDSFITQTPSNFYAFVGLKGSKRVSFYSISAKQVRPVFGRLYLKKRCFDNLVCGIFDFVILGR